MSAVKERPRADTACPQCGAQLRRPDQDWCLECGAAVRTRVRAAPDWRVPAAIVGGIVALVAAGLVLALVALSNTADKSVPPVPAAAAPAVRTPRANRPAAPTTQTKTTASTPASSTIASWPTGVTGYTVVVGVLPAKAAATTMAKKIAAAGIRVGILSSSDYSSMRPGDWIVFSGTYTTRASANTAAAELRAKGQTGAYSFPVVPAG